MLSNSPPTKKMKIILSPPTNQPTIQRSDSEAIHKSLSGVDLIIQVSRMIKDHVRAELIMLELMEEYNFDFSEFKKLLKGTLALIPLTSSALLSKSLINPTPGILDQNFEVNFSRVRYIDITPKLGLSPKNNRWDIPTFLMFQTCLSNDLFQKILEDIQIFMFQYRPLPEHETEEARSRFLSAASYLFRDAILNY